MISASWSFIVIHLWSFLVYVPFAYLYKRYILLLITAVCLLFLNHNFLHLSQLRAFILVYINLFPSLSSNPLHYSIKCIIIISAYHKVLFGIISLLNSDTYYWHGIIYSPSLSTWIWLSDGVPISLEPPPLPWMWGHPCCSATRECVANVPSTPYNHSLFSNECENNTPFIRQHYRIYTYISLPLIWFFNLKFSYFQYRL